MASRLRAIAIVLLSIGCGQAAGSDGSADSSVEAGASDGASSDSPAGLDAVGSDSPVTMDVPTDAGAGDAPTFDVVRPDAPIGACPAATLAARLGRTRLMVGGSMDDPPFRMAPFDIRYRYLSGDVPAPGPCASCLSCTIRGQNCLNSGPGCSWWGCWQWDMAPPGRYVADFVTSTMTARAIPMISYYVWYSVAGDVEGMPEVMALRDGARVTRYLADWRFVCRTIAAATTGPVILHLEPDLWGYGEQISADPSTIPVSVSAAGLAECAGMPDTLVGFARCMTRIARVNAPSALVGFHASAWGAGDDAIYTTRAGFDVDAHAMRTAAYMRALGATDGDLVVIELSDRDSGFNMRWLDETNRAQPTFTRALQWARTLGTAMNLPTLYWQLPYGHRGLENRCNRYEDNRVAYIFDHPDEFARAGAIGVAFGAGATCQTTPSTDDGYFVRRAMGYFGTPATRPCLCGAASCM